jgi:hypothetical protein
MPKNLDFLEITRMIPKATQISKRDNNSEEKVLFITNTNATKFTRFTTHSGAALFHKLPYSRLQDFRDCAKILEGSQEHVDGSTTTYH